MTLLNMSVASQTANLNYFLGQANPAFLLVRNVASGEVFLTAGIQPVVLSPSTTDQIDLLTFAPIEDWRTSASLKLAVSAGNLLVDRDWLVVPGPSTVAISDGSAVSTSMNATAGSITVPSGISTVYADASAGDVTLTLPFASVSRDKSVRVKKVDASSNKVIIRAPPGELIDNVGSVTLGIQNDTRTSRSDGIRWNLF